MSLQDGTGDSATCTQIDATLDLEEHLSVIAEEQEQQQQGPQPFAVLMPLSGGENITLIYHENEDDEEYPNKVRTCLRYSPSLCVSMHSMY